MSFSCRYRFDSTRDGNKSSSYFLDSEHEMPMANWIEFYLDDGFSVYLSLQDELTHPQVTFVFPTERMRKSRLWKVDNSISHAKTD